MRNFDIWTSIAHHSLKTDVQCHKIKLAEKRKKKLWTHSFVMSVGRNIECNCACIYRLSHSVWAFLLKCVLKFFDAKKLPGPDREREREKKFSFLRILRTQIYTHKIIESYVEYFTVYKIIFASHNIPKWCCFCCWWCEDFSFVFSSSSFISLMFCRRHRYSFINQIHYILLIADVCII